MKLGLLTAPFADQSLDEVSTWAGKAGFSAIEIAVWPRSGDIKRRYAGTSHINVETLTQRQADRIFDDLATKGLEISSLAYYPNPLYPDPAVSGLAICASQDSDQGCADA